MYMIDVLVMGIPGVGKSTLARKLVEGKGKQFVHVEFDALYTAEAEEAGLQSRFDPKRWRAVREKMLLATQAQLTAPSPPRAVLVDDNFQYRSMRLQYARLASECSAPFCTVYLRCEDVSLAKRLNSLRCGAARVPDTVIDEMHASIEPPNPARCLWEANTYTVDAQLLVGSDSGALDNQVQSIHEWLRSSVADSVVVLTREPRPDLSEEQERSAAANAKSEKHQFDLWSRKVVAGTVSSALESTKRSAVASECAKLRKAYLSGPSFGDEAKSDFLRDLAEKIK